MWWWSIYEKVAPLFIQCDNAYGLKIPLSLHVNYVENVAGGLQRIVSEEQYQATFTLCPTRTTFVLTLFAVIGLVACTYLLAKLIVEMTYPLVSEFLAQPDQSTQLTFEKIMQELDKAAQELKQAK